MPVESRMPQILKSKPQVCKNGTPSKDPKLCQGQEFCASCSAGYHKAGPACMKNAPCKCPGGSREMDFKKCNGQVLCVRCSKGFMMAKGTKVCVKKGHCACPNGKPVVDSQNCKGQVWCKTCQVGFKLLKKGRRKGAKKRCVAKKPCTCPNGTPLADKAVCDGQMNCARCDSPKFREAYRPYCSPKCKTHAKGGKTNCNPCKKSKPPVCPAACQDPNVRSGDKRKAGESLKSGLCTFFASAKKSDSGKYCGPKKAPMKETDYYTKGGVDCTGCKSWLTAPKRKECVAKRSVTRFLPKSSSSHLPHYLLHPQSASFTLSPTLSLL